MEIFDEKIQAINVVYISDKFYVTNTSGMDDIYIYFAWVVVPSYLSCNRDINKVENNTNHIRQIRVKSIAR